MTFRSFRFQTDVALARHAIRSAGNFFPIHRQSYAPIDALDAVMVPFALRFDALLTRQRTHPTLRMPLIRNKRRAVNREHIAMPRGNALRMIAIDDLDFHSLRKRLADSRNGRAVNEEPCV